jgi:hypothetical protein
MSPHRTEQMNDVFALWYHEQPIRRKDRFVSVRVLGNHIVPNPFLAKSHLRTEQRCERPKSSRLLGSSGLIGQFKGTISWRAPMPSAAQPHQASLPCPTRPIRLVAQKRWEESPPCAVIAFRPRTNTWQRRVSAAKITVVAESTFLNLAFEDQYGSGAF